MILHPQNPTLRRQQQQQQGQQPRVPQANRPPDPESYRLRMLQNPHLLAQVGQHKPELVAALHDPVRFREAMSRIYAEERERLREKQREAALLNNDPLNVEAQREIEERIRLDRVSENAQEAYMNNPEGTSLIHMCPKKLNLTLPFFSPAVYGRVTMLYINTSVNGHPIKALVDSGAQATIMSVPCAEACGIMRLLDKRYSGVAKGVGTARILGHVHSAEITIGDAILRCSFTVMEGKDIDLLFGLDMLKRYQACIDLLRNKLIFQGHEVAFLPESEIPKHLEEAALNEPTVPGPNGTEIGAKSGAIRPAGSSSHAAASSAGAAAGSSSSSSALGTGAQSFGTHSNANASANASSSASADKTTQAKPSAASATPMYPQSAIDQLVSLGFSRDEAVLALNATDGNVDYAAGLLFQN